MKRAEFDRFAEEYAAIHRSNIGASGEGPEYFPEYKMRDFAAVARAMGIETTGAGFSISVRARARRCHSSIGILPERGFVVAADVKLTRSPE